MGLETKNDWAGEASSNLPNQTRAQVESVSQLNSGETGKYGHGCHGAQNQE
jgi:hypothetical protein